MRSIILALLLLAPQAWADTLGDAKQVVSKLAYLGQNQPQTGCYSRATFITLNLHQAGLPAFNVFIFGAMNPMPGVEFDYHVAAGFFPSADSAEPHIFDPIFGLQALSQAEWIQKLSINGPAPKLVYLPAGEFGDPRKIRERDSADRASLKTPRFAAGQIAYACQTLHRLTEFEASTKGPRQRSLLTDFDRFIAAYGSPNLPSRGPRISCLPQATELAAVPTQGASYRDANWFPNALSLAATKVSNQQIELALSFPSRRGGMARFKTAAISLQAGFTGYYPVFVAHNPQQVAGFLELSFVGRNMVRGQLFGEPFRAALNSAE